MFNFSEEDIIIMLAVNMTIFSAEAGWALHKGIYPRGDAVPENSVNDNADDGGKDRDNNPFCSSGEVGKQRIDGGAILSFLLRCGIALYCMFRLFCVTFA